MLKETKSMAKDNTTGNEELNLNYHLLNLLYSNFHEWWLRYVFNV